jgi:hypothetical protein
MIRHWCCPFCGMKFFMNNTGESGTNHRCSGYEGQYVVIPNPFTSTKRIKPLEDKKNDATNPSGTNSAC